MLGFPKWLIVTVLILLSLNFWQPVFLPNLYSLCATIFCCICAVTVVVKQRPELKALFGSSFALFYLGIAGAAVSCNMYWGQTYSDSLLRVFHFEIYFGAMYLVLRYLNPSNKTVETALIIVWTGCAIVFVFQQAMGSTHFFGEISEDARGTAIRLRIPGGVLFSVVTMMAFNKLMGVFSKRMLVLFCISFGLLLMQGFRTYIAALLFGLGVIMAANIKLRTMAIVKCASVACILLLAYQSPFVQKISQAMMEKTEDQLLSSSDEDDIRLQSLYYYFNVDHRTMVQKVLGSGFPVTDNAYHRYYKVIENHGLYRVDLGLIGYYLFAGGFVMIAIAAIFLTAFRGRVSSEFLYLKVMYLYFLLISLTTIDFYRLGSFGIEGALLYMIEKEGASIDPQADTGFWGAARHTKT